MSGRPQEELLFDSEASLRLVDRALTDLRVQAGETPDDPAVLESRERPIASSRPQNSEDFGLMDVPNMLLRAYTEINSVLQNLRHSRDVLQQTTFEKIQHTNEKLREISSATEIAATDMLDGLDRALAMVDEMETSAGGNAAERESELRGDLRNELFGLMTCLQFQDITTQQLNYASSVLVEMEQRLTEVARIFDPDRLGIRDMVTETIDAPQAAFDPAATTSDAERRQALVDEIFSVDRR